MSTNAGTERSLIRNSACEEVRTESTGQPLGGVKSAVTITHLLNQIKVLHLEKLHKCKIGHFAQVCKENAKKVHEFTR